MKSASHIITEARLNNTAHVEGAILQVLEELYAERFKVLGSGNESTYVDSEDVLYLINELKQRLRYL